MRHLYVHVPFCARRCSYCDFAIAVRRTVPSARFVDAVLAEYHSRRVAERWGATVFETLYLGGGTPSRLAPDAVARLLDAFPRADGAEVTLEANPDDVTEHAARTWVAHGVTRVSLGVQSFDDVILRWMHRTHAQAVVPRAVATLRDAGITSVAIDLIFAIPEGLGHDLARDLDRALALAPDHLSAYGLTMEPRTAYARWVARGTARPAPDERYAREFLTIHDALTAAGYAHYEVSNYARIGVTGGPAQSRHNSAYWSGAAYAGLGPSAHGFDGAARRWNVRDWAAYVRAVEGGADPLGGTEQLTERDRELERVYLTLRTDRGLGTDDGAPLAPDRMVAAVGRGWLTREGGLVRCTPRGWLVLDELVATLTTLAEGG
jgi:oxygen-independent coproporphyrinogen-3 oxidase